VWYTSLSVYLYLSLSVVIYPLISLGLHLMVSFEYILNTWADIINRADLGMEVMHERNAHNFPLDLA
jgi:hypothetical protein